MPAFEAVVLPETTRPSKYRITLQPDLSNFTFKGEQSVDLEVLEPTATIVLNSVELKISSATLFANDAALASRSVTIDKEAETATRNGNPGLRRIRPARRRPLGDGLHRRTERQAGGILPV